MIFKLAFRNIKKSVKDYGIYFFTVTIGIALFYVFNAVETQSAMMQITKTNKEIIRFLVEILSAVSLFVSGILGALIIYANELLIKRRKKEFGIYQILGMKKSTVSCLLFFETLLVGLVSVLAGIVIGALLSQVMGIVLVNLFEVNLTKFQFVFSMSAMWKSIFYFGIMYLVVMLFNMIIMSRMRIIEMLRKKETAKIPVKNPFVALVIFIAGVAILVRAYLYVIDYKELIKLIGNDPTNIIIPILMGIVSTFMIFYSLTTIAILIFSHTKSYYKKLNAFIFKQISSQISTMVTTISFVCIMLFLTICILSTALTIRDSVNSGFKKRNPADIAYTVYPLKPTNNVDQVFSNIEGKRYDYTKEFSQYAIYKTYEFTKQDFNLRSFVGKAYPQFSQQINTSESYGASWHAMSVSDYNKIASVYHTKKYHLKENQYMMLCTADFQQDLFNAGLSEGSALDIDGHHLTPKYKKIKKVTLMNADNEVALTILPDSALTKRKAIEISLTGNYKDHDKKHAERLFNAASHFDTKISKQTTVTSQLQNKSDDVGTTVLVTFVGLYIGIIFLLSSAAVLALKSLSHTIDSQERYQILKKIGTDPKDITHALFIQNLFLFVTPLLLAVIHSVMGIKFVILIFGTTDFLNETSLIHGTVMMVLIYCIFYGGYFFITYFMNKNIISNRRM